MTSGSSPLFEKRQQPDIPEDKYVHNSSLMVFYFSVYEKDTGLDDNLFVTNTREIVLKLMTSGSSPTAAFLEKMYVAEAR